MNEFYPKKEVLPGLFVGSAYDARDPAFLRQVGLVVNCSKTIPFAGGHQRMQALRIAVDDNPADNHRMLHSLPLAVKTIDEALGNRQVVLVHCFAGMQRSATVAAAYLMFKLGIRPEEAMRTIKRVKPEAFEPQPTFARALREWYFSL